VLSPLRTGDKVEFDTVESGKSTVLLWPHTHWQQSRLYWQQSWTYRQQSRLRQDVKFTSLPICCQNRQQRRPYRQHSRPYLRQSTLLPICCRFRQQSTFNKVDRVEFNFVVGVYRALDVLFCCVRSTYWCVRHWWPVSVVIVAMFWLVCRTVRSRWWTLRPLFCALVVVIAVHCAFGSAVSLSSL